VRVQYVQLKYNYKTKGYTAQQCWKQSSSRSRNGVFASIKCERIYSTSSFENWVQHGRHTEKQNEAPQVCTRIHWREAN
jgi:hypothetical protein